MNPILGCPTHFSLSWSCGRGLRRVRLLLACLAVALSCALVVRAQATTFTYQGRLTDGSTAASGTYQMQFALFDAESAGTQIGTTQTNATVSVANSVFTVQLDFGAAAFPGANRYLEISVKRPPDTAYATLIPRQELTSAPYAIQSLNAMTATNATQLNGLPASQYVLSGDTRLSDARPPAAGSTNYIQNATSPQAESNFNISGDGTAGGTLTGDVVSATTQYKIGGSAVLSVTGTNNTFTGVGAGGANISGTDNSYFGRSAAGGSETGNHNSFFGANAGVFNTTNDNSFLGSQAGLATTSGAGNSFFGRSTGIANTEGADNAFFGRRAGANNTTGAGNTFIGTLTGAGNLSGSNNTLIGNGANTTANNLTNATAIGAGATAIASNTVTLGRSADTVRVPGALNVTGPLNVTGALNADGANLANLNASNILSGTLANARLGVVPAANGGTGLGAPGAPGNLLRSNGSSWTTAALAAADIPAGSTNYVQNRTTEQATSNFSISGNGTAGGTLSGNIVNAAKEYDIGGNRVLISQSSNLFAGIGAGTASLTASVRGGGNSFFGTEAGASNTTGSANSFVGNAAGASNTTGGSNAFVGNEAGNQNTVGDFNSFFGGSAGLNNTTGDFNTFVGSLAGLKNTTGSSNIFVGRTVGLENTTGSKNSFFGLDSGRSNTSGANNTLIGAETQVSSGNLSFATAIGSGAVVNTSNTIVLGRASGADKVRINGIADEGNLNLCINSAGMIAYCSSSLRYKTNLAPFSLGLDLINQLQPITFDWKADGMKDVGFGAEDVARINPLFVTFNRQGEVEGVKYDRLGAVFVNAFKEQQTQIQQQERQLQTQQEKLNTQQEQLDSLRRLLCLDHPGAAVCSKTNPGPPHP
jgi:hypothetical protein